ncbi:MAG: hypothetical protein AB1782_18430 [Cyanobacteriota bacterium]
MQIGQVAQSNQQRPQGPPAYIMQKLQKYGLQPQGSLQADLAAIQSYEQQNGINNNQQVNGQNKKKGNKPPGPPPEIMAQLLQYGLRPQGSLQADLAAIENAKAQQENGNTKKDTVNNLNGGQNANPFQQLQQIVASMMSGQNNGLNDTNLNQKPQPALNFMA